jgi:DNA-binding NarL/FixJ family response regulator
MLAPNAEIHVLEPYRVRYGKSQAVAARSARAAEAQPALRVAATNADASATTVISLSSLWRELARGSSRVVDGFFSEERCYLVLSPKNDGGARSVSARRLKILEAVLGGVLQKNIAFGLTLAPSTVALNSRLALASFGVDGRPSRAHPLLMFAARAVSDSAVVLAKCSTFIGPDDRELRVVGMPRPDRCLAAILPAAELAVIRGLVEGLCYEEIARRRGTATRTIANQIGAVFRRLRVSGRNELVQRLFVDDASASLPFEPLSKTLAPPAAAAPKAVAGLHAARRSA